MIVERRQATADLCRYLDLGISGSASGGHKGCLPRRLTVLSDTGAKAAGQLFRVVDRLAALDDVRWHLGTSGDQSLQLPYPHGFCGRAQVAVLLHDRNLGKRILRHEPLDGQNSSTAVVELLLLVWVDSHGGGWVGWWGGWKIGLPDTTGRALWPEVGNPLSVLPLAVLDDLEAGPDLLADSSQHGGLNLGLLRRVVVGRQGSG